jgi:hypothetical protein
MPSKPISIRNRNIICYLLYFPEKYLKQLDQDEIIKVLDHSKDDDPEWHEVMVNANIDIFEMYHEESVSHFMQLENLEMIRHTIGRLYS